MVFPLLPLPFSCIIILKPTVYTKLMYIIPLALNKKEWVSKAIWGKNHFVNLQVFQGRFKLQVCGGEWKAKIVARFGQIWRLSQICSYACLLSLSYYYSFNLFVCGVSELERELLLLVYIMIKFLFISSALSRIGENEPSSSIKRPLACSKLCWLLSREKAFIAAEVVANNQVSSRVTEDYIYTIGSGRSDITSKLQLKIYYCTGLFLRRWWWWRKCATTFHQIMNFTHP